MCDTAAQDCSSKSDYMFLGNAHFREPNESVSRISNFATCQKGCAPDLLHNQIPFNWVWLLSTPPQACVPKSCLNIGLSKRGPPPDMPTHAPCTWYEKTVTKKTGPDLNPTGLVQEWVAPKPIPRNNAVDHGGQTTAQKPNWVLIQSPLLTYLPCAQPS